ncbi:hypothetical protein [Pseudomonas frederiksbergensis]|uniref:hypothetical protein n=1 Tax=Pseudomonas frederiksbergensis TaxID=104087 RepID=UPI0013747EC6|nr:hypothetical protein [Pseudomonas frederiksbergensis]
MNYWFVLSLITALLALILIGLTMFLNEDLMFLASLATGISVYLDHLGIEKSFRDFRS